MVKRDVPKSSTQFDWHLLPGNSKLKYLINSAIMEGIGICITQVMRQIQNEIFLMIQRI
jgi:hypothetical protein